MAAEITARINKHPTIAFTLPISCQICLGKVKNPVLCPNNHVFCVVCMDVWLEKNKNCPACRVPMTSSKQIMGGLSQHEEDTDRLTNPDLRKARFDLLYIEYENEFERMQSEVQLLKAENQILKQQQTRKDGASSSNKLGDSDRQTDSNQLLTFTRKLQEANKQYEKLKGELTRFKQENSSLKDENLSLNRENQNLRQELAGRSPQRFGRTTVSTLETKLTSAGKDITRLTKALERSDNYIEELEKALEGYREKSESSKNEKLDKVNIYLTNGDIGKMSSDFKVPPPRENSIETDNPSRRQLFAEDRSKESKSSTGERSKYNYESNGDYGVYTNEPSSNKTFKTSNITNGKKKVTFDLEKNTNTTSFDLELPSPLKSGNASSVDSGRISPAKGLLKKSNNKPSDKSNDVFSTDTLKTLDDSFCQSYDVKYLDKFSRDDDLINFKSRPASDEYTKQHKKDFVDEPSDQDPYAIGGNDYNKFRGNEYKRSNSYKIDRNATDFNTNYDDLNPRISSDGALDRQDLDDTQYIASELDELNISLTPEFTDCMKILNRAEKMVNTRDITPPTDDMSSQRSGGLNDLDSAFRASTGSSALGEHTMPGYKSETNKLTSSLNTYSDGRHVRAGSLDNLLVNKMPVDKYYQSSSANPSNIHPLATQSKYTGGLTTGRTKLTRTPSLDNLLSHPTSTGYGSKCSTGVFDILPAHTGVPSYLDPPLYGENKDKVDMKSSTGVSSQSVTDKHDLISTHDLGGTGSYKFGSLVGDICSTLDPAVQSRSVAVTDVGSAPVSYSTRTALDIDWKLPVAGRQTSTVPISSTGATDFDKHYTSGRVTPTIPTHSEYMALSRASDKYSYTSALSSHTGDRYTSSAHTIPTPLTDFNPSTKTNNSGSGLTTPSPLTNYNPSTTSYSNYSEYRFSGPSSLPTDLSHKPPAGPKPSEFSGARTNVPNNSAYTNTGDGYHSLPTNTISNLRTGVRDQLDNQPLSSAEYDIRSNANKYNNSVPPKTSGYNSDKLDLIGSANYRSEDLYSASSNTISAYNDHNYRDGTDFSNFSTKIAVTSNHGNYPLSLAANVLSTSSAGPPSYSLGPSSSSYPGSSSYLATTLPSKSSGSSYSTAHSVPLTYTTSSYTSSIPTNTYSSKPLDPITESGQYSYVSNVSADYSSRNDTFALPEPRKRLFESSDDLEMSMSPIKANRKL